MSEKEEHQLRRELDRAQQARAIIDSDIWAETWTSYTGNLLARMGSPDTPDDEVLAVRRMLVATRQARKDLEKLLETGEMAKIGMETIRKQRGEI